MPNVNNEPELLLSRGGRDIAVKVYLTADEYLALEAIVERRGEDSHSGFFRRLFKRETVLEVQQFSQTSRAVDSTDTGLNRG